MKTSSRSWLRGLTAAGLVMALAAWAPAQEERGDDAPRDEGRSVLTQEDDRAAPPAPRNDEEAPPAPRDEEAAPPATRDDDAQAIEREDQSFERRDARDLREPPASPSDLQPIPQNEMRRDMRFQQRGYTRGSFQGGYQQPAYHHHAYDPCCCGGGQVMYHQGYRSAQLAPQSGYRSFSYQPSEPVVAPAPVYNGGYVSDGYVGGGYYTGYGDHSSPRWQDHDARSFRGNYSSRATVHHGR